MIISNLNQTFALDHDCSLLPSPGSQGSRVRLLVTECWDGVRPGAAAACLDDDSIAPAPDKYNYT